MRALRIADAFDMPVIAAERLDAIVAKLKAVDPVMVRCRDCHSDGGLYKVQLLDLGDISNPITLTEAELSAVQAAFRGFEGAKAALINAKLDEAGRRIEEAVDYVAELRGRTSAMPGRQLIL